MKSLLPSPRSLYRVLLRYTCNKCGDPCDEATIKKDEKKGSKKMKREKKLSKRAEKKKIGQLVHTAKIHEVKQKEGDCSVNECIKELPRVIIVGAGMAGLSAGQRLAKAGMTNFSIVEATNRIGGRVNSAWSGESVNEWGAEWLEGDWNPVLRLAALEGLCHCPQLKNSIYLTPDGRPIDSQIVSQMTILFKSIKQQAASLFSMDKVIEGSLSDFFDTKFKNIKHLCNDSKLLLNSLKDSVGMKWGTKTEDISLRYYGSVIESSERVRIAEGMSGVMAPLIKDIPKEKIILCKPVENVDWTTRKVMVNYADGSQEEADYVLVTCSLGVLKENPELFTPHLPKAKKKAIDSLGFGTINKVFFDYKDPFWLKTEGSFFLAQKKPTDWKSSIQRVEEVCSGRNTLEFSVAGDAALEIEEVDEETIAKEATLLFREFTGVKTLPFPISVTRTQWHKDPYYGGAVSFLAKCSSISSQCDLGTPIPGPGVPDPPRLLFAGEATAPGHFGSVAGARLSGFREAERIIALTHKYGGPPKEHTTNN